MKLAYKKTSLDNGLRILTCAMPHTYSVGVGFYVAVGSRYEQPATAGSAHFVEHMLFKGTTRRPSAEVIAREIEGHGGVFNASTGQEMTVLWAKMQHTHLPLALDVLADMLRNSLLQPEEVEKERRVILEEISSSQDVPEELVSLHVQELTWPGHPLGWDVAGTPVSVTNLGRSMLQEFLQTHYGPQSTVLAVAGAIQHDKVTSLAAGLLGDWQQIQPRDFVPAPEDGAAPRATVANKRIEQTHLVLHFPGMSRGDEDRFALTLLNVVLGEGMSSRLFLEIRERLGLAYAVDSYTSNLADTGIVGIYAAVDPERTGEALSAVYEQLCRLRDEPVDAATLGNAREFVKGRMLLSLEDTLSVAAWYGRQEALGVEIMTVEQVIQRLEQVTPEDLQRVARRVFRANGSKLALVGPHRRSESGRFRAALGEALS